MTTPCTCSAYRFPHRPGGGSCYQGKHCTFGARTEDWILAILQEFGVRSSSTCDHVQELNETCVGCPYLASAPTQTRQLVAAMDSALGAANAELDKLSPGTRLTVGIGRRP